VDGQNRSWSLSAAMPMGRLIIALMLARDTRCDVENLQLFAEGERWGWHVWVVLGSYLVGQPPARWSPAANAPANNWEPWN
jgi:hypothetical protein